MKSNEAGLGNTGYWRGYFVNDCPGSFPWLQGKTSMKEGSVYGNFSGKCFQVSASRVGAWLTCLRDSREANVAGK